MKNSIHWILLVLAAAFFLPEKHWPEFLKADLQLGAKYRLIHEGMTMEEVDAILGRPTEPMFCTMEGPGGGGLSWTSCKTQSSASGKWKSRGQYIGIGFNRGRVRSISRRGIE